MGLENAVRDPPNVASLQATNCDSWVPPRNCRLLLGRATADVYHPNACGLVLTSKSFLFYQVCCVRREKPLPPLFCGVAAAAAAVIEKCHTA